MEVRGGYLRIDIAYARLDKGSQVAIDEGFNALKNYRRALEGIGCASMEMKSFVMWKKDQMREGGSRGSLRASGREERR